MKVAVLHPGAMGASVAAAIGTAGHDVIGVTKGRRQATIDKARGAQVSFNETLEEAMSMVDLVVRPKLR